MSIEAREWRMMAKHSAVSLTGFALDAALLHLLIDLGMEPAWARAISLGIAMQVTFALNGIHVFRGLARDHRLLRQWASYMATNGVGNLANYWIFVTLVSLHWPVVSLPIVAMSVGALAAWAINYACSRFLVFGRARRAVFSLSLSRAARESSPR